MNNQERIPVILIRIARMLRATKVVTTIMETAVWSCAAKTVVRFKEGTGNLSIMRIKRVEGTINRLIHLLFLVLVPLETREYSTPHRVHSSRT